MKDYYFIMRDTPNTQTLIVEYGFLDSPEDATRLKQNFKKYAEAVVKAVADYTGIKYTPQKIESFADTETTLPAENIHIVKKGDTLWNIAKKNGLTVDELKKINNLTNNSISIGQKLFISEKLSVSAKLISPFTDREIYNVQSGDSLYSIANKYGTTINNIKLANNLINDTLSINQKLIIPFLPNNDYSNELMI